MALKHYQTATLFRLQWAQIGMQESAATTRPLDNRKGSQIGRAPCIITLVLLISSCANLNPLKVAELAARSNSFQQDIRTCRPDDHR
jgi:hypothetical protein